MVILADPRPHSTNLTQLDLFSVLSDEIDFGSAVECWLPVPGWFGYEVSDQGRVRSCLRRGRAFHSLGPYSDKSHPVGGHVGTGGHLNVWLTRYVDGVKDKQYISIHILVLEAFVGPRPPGLEGCHNNGIPSDNRLENLRWDTPSSNMVDRIFHGGHPNLILNPDDIPEIWRRLVAGEANSVIAKDYGVDPCAISEIKVGNNWWHITEKLPGYPLVCPKRNDKKPIRIHGRYTKPGTEIWKPVPGFEETHRVSTLGRVQSRLRHGPRYPDGSYRLNDFWTDLNPDTDKDGYKKVVLYDRGKPNKFFVHVLVLETFACPRPDGMLGCHNNGDPGDNRAANLRWDTHRENALDITRHANEKAASTLLQHLPASP